MKKELIKMVVAIVLMFFPIVAVSAHKPTDNVQNTRLMDGTYRMQIPFIENQGQLGNKDISFYAKSFGGTLFVWKNGTIAYSFVSEDNGGVVIWEIITDRNVEVRGLNPSPTKINYFKGQDKNKWRTNIPSYEGVSLGQVYKGIDLRLKAYGNNVEKLFTVLPGANPNEITVKLKEVMGLKVS
jgi:hypothetical protein